MLEDTVTCQLDDQVTSPESLSMAMKQAMFELFRQYYDAVSFSSFELDLMAKDHVLMLNDKEGQLRGFTSMALIEFRKVLDRLGLLIIQLSKALFILSSPDFILTHHLKLFFITNAVSIKKIIEMHFHPPLDKVTSKAFPRNCAQPLGGSHANYL